jgi:hypothetical protein
MPGQLLPQRIDNSYRGHKLALWLFGLVVLVKTGIGVGTIFNGRDAAINADGIPLDAFTPAGAQAFVSVFAAWGLAQVTIGVLCILVLIRYRALVPFMFALLLLEHLLRRLIFFVLPMPRIGEPPGFVINLALVAVMIVGLGLSLWNRDRSQTLGTESPARRPLG